jgi:hypothetical protein
MAKFPWLGDEMLSDDIKTAIGIKDKTFIAKLIASIPLGEWAFPGASPYAQTLPEDTDIVVQRISGGSGINTYERAGVTIWRSDELVWYGTFSSDELRLPNYISVSERN